jgi:hypothetical protein
MAARQGQRPVPGGHAGQPSGWSRVPALACLRSSLSAQQRHTPVYAVSHSPRLDKAMSRTLRLTVLVVLILGLAMLGLVMFHGEPATAGMRPWDASVWTARTPTRIAAEQQPPYDPFTLADRPACWPMTEAAACDPATGAAVARVDVRWNQDQLPIGFSVAGTDGLRLTLVPVVAAECTVAMNVFWIDGRGQRLCDPMLVRLDNDEMALLQSPRVWFTDANRDGVFDALIHTGTNGNGLMAHLGLITTVLSTGPSRWQTWATQTYMHDAANLLVDPANGSCVLVTTDFTQADGSDAKRHSFWMHSASTLTTRGPEPLSAGTWLGFPRCVQYTEKPNHTETRLLPPVVLAELKREAANTAWARMPEVTEQGVRVTR